ncbi:hypothetical protein [Salana multivorans]
MVAEPVETIDDDVDVAASGLSSTGGSGLDQDAALGALNEAAAGVSAGLAALKGALTALEETSGHLGRANRQRLVADFRTLLAGQDMLAALVTQAAGLVESSGAWREESAGARNFGDWLGRATRHGTGGGRRIQEKARTLEAMPVVKEAATTPGSGMSDAHVSQVARALESSPPGTRERVVEAQAEILLLAKTRDAASFGRDLRARIAALEADSADASFEEAHNNRFLRLSPSNGSVKVEGMLDPVAGETVRRALEALTPVPSEGDPRTSGQLSADALEVLAGRVLSYGEKKGSLNRPQITVVMREETFLAARTRQRVQAERSPSRQGSSAGGLSGEAFRRSGLRTEPPLAQLEDGTALPPAAVEALLCDAEVQRLVVDPAGQPLDVGLATRSFTADLRVAILRRDRHCQFPQCALRASWCDIHHRRYWSDDGPTSLENGITLCSFHHHRVHAESIWIRAVSGGFVFISRDGRRIGTTTRLHDQILVPQPWPSTDPPPREPRPQKRTPAERERDEWRPGENSAQIWERTSCCDGMERSYVRTGILRNEPEWVSEPGKKLPSHRRIRQPDRDVP